MKRWTKADEYRWKCEQADLVKGETKRLDSKKGYYRAEKEPAVKPKKEEKSKGVVLIRKYYRSSITTVFSPSEKTGTLTNREFFKALYA